jgi:alpha-mannosidase
MNSQAQMLRSALGVPEDAKYVLIYDQSAHLDWDWTQTFNQYFQSAYGGSGVNGALWSALNLLAVNGPGKTGPYYYSICEMGYLQNFVKYQAQQGNDVITMMQAAGNSLRIVGGGITSPDNLVCSGEAFLRCYLLGKLWLAQNLPGTLPLKHCWLPDDFGQDPELPVAVRAMGMISVAFQRLPGTYSYGSTTNPQQQLMQHGIDFFWQCSDPNSVVFARWLQTNSVAITSGNNSSAGYCEGSDIAGDPLVIIYDCLCCHNFNQSASPPYSAAPTNYLYVPNDCDFKMPVTGLLGYIDDWNTTQTTPYGYANTGVYVVQASFDDFVSLVLSDSSSLQTIQYNGTPYWTGYYMSRPALKILHYRATRNLLAAEVFGLLAAPGILLDPLYQQRVSRAWNDLMPSTHHDYVCGTASDQVYQLEQLPLLQTAQEQSHRVLVSSLLALAASVEAPGGDNVVVIANPAGTPFSGVVELEGPIPDGKTSVQFSEAYNAVQPTYEGGLLFAAKVPSAGYVSGTLTGKAGSLTSKASIASGSGTYTLANDYMTVTVSAAGNWGITAITDAAGNSLLQNDSVANDLVFYEDGGDIYEFGNEYTTGIGHKTFQPGQVTFVIDGPGLGATVLEEGPLRARLRTVVSVRGLPSTQNYTREYCLVAGEPYLRLSTSGAAPQPSNGMSYGYSVMTAFPLASAVTSINHGTACHWTSVQPLPNWPPPIFRATHHFLAPQGVPGTLCAIYHPEVPGWGFDSDGILLGCLLRNTPGGPHAANGTDTAEHTLHYAFRIPDNLGGPHYGPAAAGGIELRYAAEGHTAASLSPGSAGRDQPRNHSAEQRVACERRSSGNHTFCQTRRCDAGHSHSPPVPTQQHFANALGDACANTQNGDCCNGTGRPSGPR